MKQLRHYIALFIIPILLITCNEELDYTSDYDLSVNNFYSNEKDLNAAIMGAYKDFTYHALMNHYFYQFLMSDDISTRSGKPNHIGVDAFNPPNDESDAFYRKTWREYWQAIYNVNTFLEHYNQANIDDDEKLIYAAQMKFLRGYAYLILTRNFGAVPLILSSHGTGTELRAKTVTLYQQIESDLKYAEQHLPSDWGNDIGRPTLWAAKAALSYLYMSWAGWPVNDATKYKNALQIASDIVLGPFSLDVNNDGLEDIKDFASLWNREEKYDGNNESIFEFVFSEEEVNSGSAELGSMLAHGMCPEDWVNSDSTAPGWQDFNAEIAFYNNYPESDPRKPITFLTSWPSSDHDGKIVMYNQSRYGKPIYNKWVSSSVKRGFYNSIFRDITIYRFADILLLYAEAENEINGPSPNAYMAINRVRKRAGLPELASGLSKQHFFEAVFNERKLELAGEGPRYWDLQRRGLLGEANRPSKKATGDFLPIRDLFDESNWVFPIPQQEILLNPNLTQYFNPATMSK